MAETQSPPSAEQQGDIAADYIEGLLDILDLDGDLDIDVENDRAVVSVLADEADPTALNMFVGQDGRVLEALQELTRLAVLQQTGERSRLVIDIGGYRSRRRDRLAVMAQDAVAKVRKSGEPFHFQPMNAFSRKVVHDAVAAEGLRSESEGEGAARHVVVFLPESA